MISNNKANWVPQGYLGTEFSPVWGEILTFGLPDIGLFVFFYFTKLYCNVSKFNSHIAECDKKIISNIVVLLTSLAVLSDD